MLDFREFRAFDTHNQIITDDGATSRDAFQLLAELCAIDVPTLLIRGAQRGASARRPCASREAEGAAADRADWAALWYFLINRIIELYRNRIELSADDLRRVTWKRAIFCHYFSVPSLSCPLRANHSHALPDPPLRDLRLPLLSLGDLSIILFDERFAHALADILARMSLHIVRYVVPLITWSSIEVSWAYAYLDGAVHQRSTSTSILSATLYTWRISINLIATIGYARQMSNVLVAYVAKTDSAMIESADG